MNSLLQSRLAAIRESLMALFRGGKGAPTAMIGAERELFLFGYLREVFPHLYRFGQGAIIDSAGRASGQVDIVLEFPIAPSLPMPAGSQRLYLAESVATVIEVKSDLSAQWPEAISTVRRVKALDRELRRSNKLLLEDSDEPDPRVAQISGIPCYVVGFGGHATMDGLKQRLSATPASERPDGALVIESGLFTGATGDSTDSEALYHFVAELVEVFNSFLGVANPQLRNYLGP